MATTETSIIVLLKRSDAQPDAWRRFAELYTAELLTWARGQGLRQADAQDVTQSILADIRGLLQHYQRKPGASFGSWLYTVTVNRCREHRRANKRHDVVGLSSVAESAEMPAFELADEAEHHRRVLQRAMDAIRVEFSETYWKAFASVAIDQRPAKEVATKLGMKVSAVYLAKHRILSRLRDVLRDLID